jgi:hypothetical protein
MLHPVYSRGSVATTAGLQSLRLQLLVFTPEERFGLCFVVVDERDDETGDEG